MLHYNPQHVSSSTLLIFRRTNCIITASGIVILCKRPYSIQMHMRVLTHIFVYRFFFQVTKLRHTSFIL